MEEDEGPPAVISRYLVLTVTTSADAAEAVAALLWELRGGGVVEEPAGDGEVALRTYLPLSAITEDTLRPLSSRLARLRDLGLTAVMPRVQTAEVSDEAWTSAWKEHFRPFRVGRRIVISPTWEDAATAPGETHIRLDPGMAFGSGLHASTQLVLTLMEERLRAGDSVADVGTGSGILAIAAARLGAGRVLAIDDDPVAIAVARDNVRQNGVAARVAVTRGHLLDPVREPVDLIVANLTAALLEDLVPSIPLRLRPEGTVIASGLIEAGVESIRRALASAGFRFVEERPQGEWRALVARRTASDDGRAAAVRATSP